MDLIGPWKIRVQGIEIEFNALTCIDPVTNLVELTRINNKTSAHVATKFEQVWLSRYPRPPACIHDNDGEFISEAFQRKLEQHAIKSVNTTSKNPQGNSICERMHQTVANVLRTKLNRDGAEVFLWDNIATLNDMLDECLATATYATRVQTHRTLGVSSGEFVFQRDMFLDFPVFADLLEIRNRRQQMVNRNVIRENRKRRDFNYRVGGEVLIKSDNPNKLEPRAHGPYLITGVHTNGTVDVRRNPLVTERLNIRRLIPYRRT